MDSPIHIISDSIISMTEPIISESIISESIMTESIIDKEPIIDKESIMTESIIDKEPIIDKESIISESIIDNDIKPKICKKEQINQEIKLMQDQIASASISSPVINLHQKQDDDDELVKLRDTKRSVHNELIKVLQTQYYNEIKNALYNKIDAILFLDELITKYGNPKGSNRVDPINTVIVVPAEKDEIGIKIFRSKFFNQSLFDFIKNEINNITNDSHTINGIRLTREFDKNKKLYSGRLFIKLTKDNDKTTH